MSYAGSKRTYSGSTISRGPSGYKPKRNTAKRRYVPSTKLTGLGTKTVNGTYTTSGRFFLGGILGNGSGTQPNALTKSFSLNELPNYTDYTNLFDQYRIDRVSVMFFPRTGNVSDSNIQTVSGQGIQLLTTAIDLSGSTTATPTIADLLEYGSVEQHLLTKPVTISFQPRIQDANGLLLPIGSFVSCENPAAVYNSLRYFTDSTLSKYTEIDVYCEMLCTFKNSK